MDSPSSVSSMAAHVSLVADYFDANTRRFLRFGGGSASGAIHRCVWTPEAVTATDAVDTVNRLVLERVHGQVPAGDGRVLDLGCAVGATMVRIAQGIGPT